MTLRTVARSLCDSLTPTCSGLTRAPMGRDERTPVGPRVKPEDVNRDYLAGT
jgi:hypothetical protein